jgi:polyhydroxyalkanoate synthase
LSLLPQLDPYAALKEIADLNSKFVEGAKKLSSVKDEEVHIATTEKELVLQSDKVSLYHYKPLTDKKVNIPVLVVYGMIGRYTMADLQQDRSLIRNMLNQGLDVYAVDWGTPSRADRWLRLEDYINGYLNECVDVIKKKHNIHKINLLGICEGGVFTLCYSASKPENIKNLITSITPVDFHGNDRDVKLENGYINLWTRNLEANDIDLIIDACGNMPGEFMSLVFQLMTPMKSLTKYNVDLLDVAHDDKKLMNFLRMEKWLADRPDHPGEAAKQWFKDLYQENKLIRNEFELDGKAINLKQINMPVLNVFALHDHIIPPECSRILKDYVGTDDYSEIPISGGHVGIFVSSKSQGILGKGIVDWLLERD